MSLEALRIASPPDLSRVWSRPNIWSKNARSVLPRKGVSDASARTLPLAFCNVLVRALVRMNSSAAPSCSTLAPSRMSALACRKSSVERVSMP